jgi:hypothetical protein
VLIDREEGTEASMSKNRGRGKRSWRGPLSLVGGAAAVGLLALAGLTSAPPDVPGPGEEAGLGSQGGKQIFYVGTVTLESRESGHYSFKQKSESGASKTITRDLNAETSGTWAVSLKAIAYESELVTAGGSGSAAVTHSHIYAEHIIDIDADKGKVEENSRSMDDPVNGPARVTVMLSAADGTYTIGLAPEEVLEVVRRSQYSRKETIPGRPAPRPVHTENAVALPLPIMAFSEPKPWVTGDSLADEYVFDDRESAGTFCPGGMSRSDESSCNYTSRTTLKWKLTRKEGECTAEVDYSVGVVSLNDMPIPYPSAFPLSMGDTITTGRKSRVQMSIKSANPAKILVGGSSTVSNGDMCGSSPGEAPMLSTEGATFIWTSKFGESGQFAIKNISGNDIDRSFLSLWRRLVMPPPLFAQEPSDNPGPEEAVLPEGWPSAGTAFYLWSDPSGAVGVKIFRGRARVEDPAAQKPVVLGPGEFYRGPVAKRAKDVVVTLLGS